MNLICKKGEKQMNKLEIICLICKIIIGIGIGLLLGIIIYKILKENKKKRKKKKREILVLQRNIKRFLKRLLMKENCISI